MPFHPFSLDILTPGRRRPPAVDSFPVQMHCRLILDVPLQEAVQTDTNNQQNIPSMLLLQVDTYLCYQRINNMVCNIHPQTKFV